MWLIKVIATSDNCPYIYWWHTNKRCNFFTGNLVPPPCFKELCPILHDISLSEIKMLCAPSEKSDKKCKETEVIILDEAEDS
jgi:hypothetical protein